MLKYTQTIRWLLPTNCLNVFGYFMGLALIGLIGIQRRIQSAAKNLGWNILRKQFTAEG